MNSAMMPVTDAPGEGRVGSDAPAAPRKIFIVHENPATGLHVLHRLKKMLHGPGAEGALQLEVWPFDHLVDPDWCDTAAADAAAADLVVLATSCTDPTPPAAGKWLMSCLALKGGRPLTLVTYFGTDEPWTISIESSPAIQTAHSRAA